MRWTRILIAPLVVAAVAACQPGNAPVPDNSPDSTPSGTRQPAQASSGARLEGTTWTLASLGARPVNLAGARGITLILAGERARGFAGCNQYSSGYQEDNGQLDFTAVISTKRGCSTGMDLEREYITALEATRSYRLTAQGLELIGAVGVVARFTADR